MTHGRVHWWAFHYHDLKTQIKVGSSNVKKLVFFILYLYGFEEFEEHICFLLAENNHFDPMHGSFRTPLPNSETHGNAEVSGRRHGIGVYTNAKVLRCVSHPYLHVRTIIYIYMYMSIYIYIQWMSVYIYVYTHQYRVSPTT